MKYVKKMCMFIAGFITGMLAFVVTRILHNRRTTSEYRDTVEQLGRSSKRLENDAERVGQSCEEIRQVIENIRKKQKLEQ